MNKEIYKKNLVVPSLKIIFDAVTIVIAIAFSYWLRFFSPLAIFFPVTKGIPIFIQYFYFSLFVTIIYICLFIGFYSYRSRLLSNLSHDIPVILKVCLLGILFAMSSAFLYRDFSYSRLVFLLIYLNTNIFLLIERAWFHKIKNYFLQKGFNILRVYLVGSDDIIGKLFEQLKTSKSHNFRMLGYLADKKNDLINLPYVGQTNLLPKLCTEDNFEALVLAFNKFESKKIMEIIKNTEGKNIELFYVPDILDLRTSNFRTFEANGILLLQLKAFMLSGWQGMIKNLFDFLVSLITLIILSPIFLLIAILIRITSKGTIFYRQERIGMDGRNFEIIKFRTMKQNAEKETGPIWAATKDPRATPLGLILRRTSLDELPQLINVVKGDMSLVGPRPERPYFVEKFQVQIPKYAERHRARSGITGWAQVNGLRGQSPIEERTRHDVYYIENWSLWFDIKILILTFIAIIKGKNAY